MRRVELGGKLSHACVECGKWCRDCQHTAFVPARCIPCSAPYVDNPPADDGAVHCLGCAAPFPDLAALRAAGLDKYPAYCRACREERRAEAAEYRERDAYTPPPPDRGVGERSEPKPPPVVPAAGPTPTPARSLAGVGGFVPRAPSEVPSALRNSRKPSEFGGASELQK